MPRKKLTKREQHVWDHAFVGGALVEASRLPAGTTIHCESNADRIEEGAVRTANAVLRVFRRSKRPDSYQY